MLAMDRCRTMWSYFGAVLCSQGMALAQDADGAPRASRAEVRPASRSLVLEGYVLAPDGSAAEGAVVVSSSGGQAVTDACGRYVLETEAPLDAGSLQVTAAGRAGTNQLASRRIALSAATGSAALDPLQLAQGVACVPHWLPTFGPEPGTSFTGGQVGEVRALAVFDDGGGPRLYVGGQFTAAGGTPASCIARRDGSTWSSVGWTDGVVDALVVFDDGSGPALYAGGPYGSQVSKWDGTSWSPVGAGLDGPVEALAVFDDGDGPALYAGGNFTGSISKWNGSSWSTVAGGIVTGDVRALVAFEDGNGGALYVGGDFFFAGGVSARRVARWDGTSWSGLANGVNAEVEDLAVFDDGGGPMLYAGGSFSMASGTPASSVACWNGTSWSALGNGVNGVVYGLAAYDDGGGPALFATGSFTSAGTTSARCIARWNGSSWSDIGGLDRPGSTIAALDDGGGPTLVVGGVFSLAGEVGANSIAKWNGTIWSAFGSGMGSTVTVLAVHDDEIGRAHV